MEDPNKDWNPVGYAFVYHTEGKHAHPIVLVKEEGDWHIAAYAKTVTLAVGPRVDIVYFDPDDWDKETVKSYIFSKPPQEAQMLPANQYETVIVGE